MWVRKETLVVLFILHKGSGVGEDVSICQIPCGAPSPFFVPKLLFRVFTPIINPVPCSIW